MSLFDAHESRRSQQIGAAWTIVYAVLTGFAPTAFRNSDAESVLVLFVFPILCLLGVFAYFRNGGTLAFGTLALATVLALPQPTLYSMLTLMVGGPMALVWSLWCAHRARRAPSAALD
jgi:hypothetical protein